MSTEITIVATITARSGYRTEVEQALRKVEREVQQEPGCEQYQLYVSHDNDHQFVMIERWQSEAMLAQHSQAEPFQALSRAIEDKADLEVVTLGRV